ncbi:DENN (AEX-3) domain containing protein [Nitzschia inconspicua]|uniref:DENN (AEX-3) domain containing protein n=1 Tax=Nitzschia inconspicua TaxID=303405 RepID=A0A9K3LQ70_9STRA|nr:DENN (AEX-3) domain containing protein [Nitzschia inconspicua]
MAAPQGPPVEALPLYDLFLDLPHPAAAAACPPPYTLATPINNPEMEKELSANMSRIARFAFPEFDDAMAQRIPRDGELNRFSQYAMQPKSFQNYTFSLQLQSGVRMHGFVRRYLPIHQVAKHRYDVGRRGERALVILTRFSGGDLLYAAILKTLDALSFQKPALEGETPHPEPRQWFLHHLFEEHKKLCAQFISLPQHERKATTLTIEYIEVGRHPLPMLEQVDTTKYLIPTSLLASNASVFDSLTSSSILPILRVLGVQSTLRLLSALLSEDRVLLVSASPTRLAQCARSALSILAQGLLNWQHLYIPVLPPHLFQYLGAPVPYLIGMQSSMMAKLEQAQSEGLGEMVIINLDSVQMETRGMNPMDVARKVPDLFQKAMSEQGMPTSGMSAPEMLAQDLLDLLKMDKRVIYGESTLTNVSETAAKATKAVKSGITSLARRGKKFLNNRMGSSNISDASGTDEEGVGVEGAAAGEKTPAADMNTMSPEFIYIQGSQHEAAEEEARIAFTSFFLSMFGNMRWYLSASPGKLPQLDRNRFLQQKRAMGEGENTPIWPLLENFCHTQMLEQFAKARVEEVRLRLPVTPDSPLFTQCGDYHRLHNIDFSVVNVRRVARQVSQNNPSRTIVQTNARSIAMLLTSNRTYEGDYNKAVAQLVEQCRECTSVLYDVMSVIWVRMRDSRGLHWKHGFQSLQILRNLLYHGPLGAIAEATDGLDKIRAMKFYNDNMRSQICTQIRTAANQVYNLLVDRAKLYNIRRLCVNKRRVLRLTDQPRFVKDTRLKPITPFRNMHQLLNPTAGARVAPAPQQQQATTSAPPVTTNYAAEPDFLGMISPSASAPPQGGSVPASVSSGGATQDMLGMFGNMAVSSQTPTSSGGGYDPFSPSPSAATPSQAANVHSSMVSPAASLQQPPYSAGQQPFGSPPPAQGFGAAAPPGGPTSYGTVPAPQQQRSLPYGSPPGAPLAQPHPPPAHSYYQQPHPGHYPPQGHIPPSQNQQPQPAALGLPPYQQQQPPPHQTFQAHAQQTQQQPLAYHPGAQSQGYPPQQYAAQQPPPAQPAKPNISQFDPFK